METPQPAFDKSWAQSLVGRDWEIYWEEGGQDNKPESDQQEKEKVCTTVQGPGEEAAVEPSPEEVAKTTAFEPAKANLPQKSEGDKDREEEDEEEEEDAYVTDWYDGTVIGFNEEGIFHVRFVGDSDTLYDMPLEPAIVRPSARSWAQRSRAILERKSGDVLSWRKDMPADTATLKDCLFMAEQRDAQVVAHVGEHSTLGSSEMKEKQDMYYLSNLVRDQIYLRSKLAPIVDSGHGASAGGEPALTDTYLNHLVKCLEEIERLCEWYQSCWLVYEKAIDGAQVPSMSSRMTVEFINEWCLKTGREWIVNLLSINVTRVGAKKRLVPLPISPSARQTKRRKVCKASGFLQPREEEGNEDFLSAQGMSLKSVKRFIHKVEQEENQWFIGPCLRMLQRMCLEIREPIRTWTRQAALILGEGSDAIVESDESVSEEHEMKESDSRDSENEEEDGETSSHDNPRHFSYEEVKACLSAATDDVLLARINLSQWTSKLQQKLDGIEAFEIDGWRLVSHIYDEVGQCTKASDDVLAGLRQIQEAAQSTNAHVINVDPLGRGSSRLTRTVIENALVVRAWILDLEHVELARERFDFVLNVLSRASTLPNVPPPPQGVSNAPSSASMSSRLKAAEAISSNAFSHVHVYNRYERMLANAESGAVDLGSIAGVAATLDELRATPVTSLVEEKLSVRYDVLTWLSCARGALPNKFQDTDFDDVERLKHELDSILNGLSPSRYKLVYDLEKNIEVDNNIRTFAKSDISQFCAHEAATVEQLYFKGRDWKERADSIISALRVHGNLTAGPPVNSNKSVAMIDVKRIDDLLAEYGVLGSKMEQRRTVLMSVREQAITWTSRVEQIIVENENVLERLTFARDERPKGVLMDPARHVVDSWIELLEWYSRVIVAFRELVTSAKSNANGPDSDESFSTLIADKIHPLMMEGLEVVALFSRNRVAPGSFSLSPDDIVGMLSRMHDSQKLQRTISIAKLEANHLGNLILSHIVENTFDAEQGSPLFCLLFLAWRVLVIHLIHRQSAVERASSDNKIQKPTLEEAKALNALRPRLHLVDSQSETTNDGIAPFHIIFSNVQTAEVARFQDLIADGERTEIATRMALSATKDLTRGSFNKTSEVRDHLATLKLLQSDFKSRVQGLSGLTLSPALEQSLDSVVKDLSWLVRTFPYLVLHFDEIPNQSDDPVSSGEKGGQDRKHDVSIPWDVLVNLHERLPNLDNDGPGGDIARVSLRVEELYEAASTWQKEITSHLSLSFRGSKRRSPGTQESDGDLTNMARLAQLAKHPILARVSMPRETAVQQVLDRAHEFEELFAALLDTDFEGRSPDKAPYHESNSLVGRSGEFLLYRLTGSALYESLKSHLRMMSSAAEAVLADTPGKAAFEWILKAVAWIDELNKSVSDAVGAVKLVIPYIDAVRIMENGNGLFLEITDELRKTLASHKIFLSTNKQTKRLTVVIGKGGALHSLGGTAIKWCPLLFEWLKEDVSRQQHWESRVVGMATAFQTVASQTGIPKDNKEAIFQWLHYREKASLLLDEGRGSLVVTPREKIVSSLVTLQSSLDAWANNLMSNPPSGLDLKALMKERYEDGATAVENRFAVLGALMNRHQLVADVSKRRSVARTAKRASIPDGLKSNEIREKARSILDKAMRRGTEMMGIDDGNCEASIYCAMKAWEIEEAMFGRFRNKSGSNLVTKKYTDKLLSLRYNLEDTKNPTLCPRVLVGEISADDLVAMSSEEMAGQQIRQTRAKAEEEGKRNATVNPGAPKNEGQTKNKGKPVDSPAEREALLKMPPQERKPNSSPKMARPLASILPQPLMSPPGRPTSRQPTDEPYLVSSSPASTPSPRHGRSSFKISSFMQLPEPPLSVASLPTPPSLAVAAAAMPQPKERMFALNASGGDCFSISVADSSRIFEAKLFLPDEASKDQVDRFLPEKLTEKARVQIDNFSNFLKDKVNKGHWLVVPLRLSVSEQSAAEYKKFYKEYESKERIAMFGKEYKIFLVTPKFHSAAKGLVLESPTSTYAVLMMKPRQFSG